MMTLGEIRRILQSEKPYLAEEYGVTELGVFGSYVRGDQRPDSDLDILVELERPPRISLLGLVELQYYLSDLLGVEVDVAIKKNLRKRTGARILSEVVTV
jgi:hypothetical protein